LFAGFTTIRSIVSVAIVLIGAFAVTGAISSSYKRERLSLGQQHYADGQALERQGQMEAALDQYREALLFVPDQQDYRLSLGIALLKAGHLDEAQAHLQQLAQEDPTNGRINLALAQVALKRKKTSEAIESYQRAVYEYWPPEAVPERRRARWELVNLLHAAGRRNDEVAELLQLYSSSPNDPAERANIGFLLVKAGAMSEAAQIFRNIELNFPQNSFGHRGLGEVNFANGDYVAARHEFQHALRVSPNDHDAQAALTLTNAVIDLDPVLPNISYQERLRRSQRLLSRTVNEMNQCLLEKVPTPVAQHQLDSARDLLARPHAAEEDYSLALQRTAAQVWQNRSSFCPVSVPPNRAIDLAIERISNE
jgi:tetratricopeptide (TPR) repeat protein